MSAFILLISGIFIAVKVFNSTGDGGILKAMGLNDLGDRHDAQHAGSAFVLILIAVWFIAAGIMSLME